MRCNAVRLYSAYAKGCLVVRVFSSCSPEMVEISAIGRRATTGRPPFGPHAVGIIIYYLKCHQTQTVFMKRKRTKYKKARCVKVECTSVLQMV